MILMEREHVVCYKCKNHHRNIFLRNNGSGPWACFFCKGIVVISNLTVHHDDGNHQNNEITNLKPSHHGCHTSFHKKGSKQTEETKEKVRKAKTGVPVPKLQGRPLTAEHRAKLSKAHTGLKWSQARIDSYEATQRDPLDRRRVIR